MSSHSLIWTALGISVAAFVACIWQFANMRGYKARGRRRGSSRVDAATTNADGTARRSDKRKLTSQEKKLYTESQRLLAEGKASSAARILEQLNMPREAIQTLEDAGQIHEAAKILMRMQRHNRAGVVYARHGMWEFAAQSFKQANMPLEVAKCYREAGNYLLAGEFFEKASRHEDAASAYKQGSDLHRAARVYCAIGQREQAMSLYGHMASTTNNIASLKLQEDELAHIVGYLGDGHLDANLASIVIGSNKLVELIVSLVGKGFVQQASDLFIRSSGDIGPQLMAEVNYQDRSAEVLAEVFLNVANFNYAGMIFERMAAFGRAGDAFEKAEDYERGIYCYERAGMDAKAKGLKEKAKNSPRRSGGRPASSAFSLSAVGTESRPSAISVFGENAGESTSVVFSKNDDTNAIPPPPERNSRDTLSPEALEGIPPVPKDFQAPPAMTLSGQISAIKPLPLSPVTSEFFLGGHADQGRFVIGTLKEQEADKNSPDEGQSTLPPISTKMPSEPVLLDEGRGVFHRAKFFEDLDFEQKNKLWALGNTHEFSAEETILTYNDEPSGVYVIVQGTVSCYRQVSGSEKFVDKMGEAETFGELWLLADQPTAVRFVASKDTQIRIIDRDPFNDLLDRDGSIARKLYKRFTMRLLKRLLRPQGIQKTLIAS